MRRRGIIVKITTMVHLFMMNLVLAQQGVPAEVFCTEGPEESHWELVGPDPDENMLQAAGLLSCVAVASHDPNIIYTATDLSGMWKTTDGGQSWRNITDTLKVPGLGFSSISLHPGKPGHLVAATKTRSYGYPDWQGKLQGYGLLTSADGGVSWRKAAMQGAENPFEYIHTVKRHPVRPDELLAAGNKKVWKSEDNGANWQLVFENPTDLPAWFIDVEFALHDPSMIYVSNKVFGYAGAYSKGHLQGTPHASQVFCSRQGGVPGSWQEVSPPHTQRNTAFAIHIVMDVSPADPIHLYSIYSLNRTHYFYKTANGGQHWTLVDSTSSSGLVNGNWTYYRHEFELSDQSIATQYAGTNTLLRSGDAGRHWQSVTQYIPKGPPERSTHADIRGILNLGYTEEGDHLLIVNDGGIARTTNGGKSWTNLNGPGLAITEFYGVDVFHDTQGERLVAGALHNGTFLYQDSTWTPFILSGDGDWTEIMHTTKGQRAYAMSNGQLYFSENLGVRYRAVPGQPEKRWVQGQRFEINPHNQNLLYGLYNLFSLNPSTGQWKTLFTKEKEDQSGSEVAVMKVAPSDSSVLYLAFDGVTWGNSSFNYKFYRTTDGGENWVNLTEKLIGSAGVLYQWAAVSDLVVDAADARKITIAIKNYGRPNGQKVTDRVLKSEDGGENWKDVSEGLPAVPVNYLLSEEGILWAATDAGVYYWEDSESRWRCFNRGFPTAIVTKMEYNPFTKVLYASTWGRGIWRVKLTDYLQSVHR